jgi:tetratricopeptide (TPR) repeat protein
MNLEETKPVASTTNGWLALAIVIFLGALTWFVFGQTLHHEFINFDDGDYVFKNPKVTRGLSLDGVGWAFTHVHAGNWHPLTWISHMADCQFFGLDPAWHHLSNLLIHVLTAALLFLVLRQMTGALWRSAFVAAVFAIHPLHVESVAWVAERKDVLSGLFFVLTIAAYVRYVRRGGLGRYAIALALFALGLMCKPMLVSLPFVLLLLDYWPLRCFDEKGTTPGKLIVEKLPFLVLGAAACFVTVFAQRAAIQPIERFRFPLRLGNAVVACVDYLRQTFWPVDLAIFYPWDAARIQWTSVGIAAGILAAVTIAVFLLRRRGYLVTGWFWFLIMLAPVIGIVQVGNQAHADRYTYLPQIGLIVMVTWGISDLVGRWRPLRYILSSFAVLALVPLAWFARVQTSFWRDSEQLWSHALAVTTDNTVAEENLGQALYQHGKIDEALFHLDKVLRIEPNDAIAHGALGAILLRVPQQQKEAFAHLQRSLEIYPNQASVQSALGVALLEAGDAAESFKHLQTAIALDPDDSDAHFNLGNTLLRLMQPKEAVAEYERAFQMNPKDTEALNNLAWVLATWPDPAGRDGARAVEWAEKADALTQQRSAIHAETLAAAYAEAGRFTDAIRTAERALKLATNAGDNDRAEFIRVQLELYHSNTPLRDQRFVPPPD